MIILALRTDTSKTYIALCDDHQILADLHWESGHELAKDLLTQLVRLLDKNGLGIKDIEGLACFSGPGSFTSLRIGVATMNTLAYSNSLPLVAATGDNWLEESVRRLLQGQDERLTTPQYGSEPNITVAKK